MTDLARLLADPALEAAAFPSTSRHHGAELKVAEGDNGEEVVYVARRFPPRPEDLEIQRRVVVVEGDRLDLLADTHFGDSTQWWRIADSSPALAPGDLTEEPGRTLPIATPRTGSGG